MRCGSQKAKIGGATVSGRPGAEANRRPRGGEGRGEAGRGELHSLKIALRGLHGVVESRSEITFPRENAVARHRTPKRRAETPSPMEEDRRGWRQA